MIRTPPPPASATELPVAFDSQLIATRVQQRWEESDDFYAAAVENLPPDHPARAFKNVAALRQSIAAAEAPKPGASASSFLSRHALPLIQLGAGTFIATAVATGALASAPVALAALTGAAALGTGTMLWQSREEFGFIRNPQIRDLLQGGYPQSQLLALDLMHDAGEKVYSRRVKNKWFLKVLFGLNITDSEERLKTAARLKKFVNDQTVPGIIACLHNQRLIYPTCALAATCLAGNSDARSLRALHFALAPNEYTDVSIAAAQSLAGQTDPLTLGLLAQKAANLSGNYWVNDAARQALLVSLEKLREDDSQTALEKLRELVKCDNSQIRERAEEILGTKIL